MSISREPEVPITCPACKGRGVGTDGCTCMSCDGSLVLLISKAAYARLTGDREKEERHRIYNGEEKKIIMGPGKRRKKLERLHAKGYTDRSYKAIGVQFKKWRAEERARKQTETTA